MENQPEVKMIMNEDFEFLIKCRATKNQTSDDRTSLKLVLKGFHKHVGGHLGISEFQL